MAFVNVGDRWYDKRNFIVDSEDDLTSLPACAPGSVAHTAGFGSAWERGIDGTWVEITMGNAVALAL